ncbi:peptidase [Microbacterium sp.]|uniref:peptidase n=1 Tax=Microbacterium sp. TaxID=51671 RepID=UPI003F71A1B3
MIVIDWLAFVQVFVAAMTGAVLVVTFYSLGLRLLVRAGRAPVVAPAEFTDAITVITEKEARRAEKAAAKAAKRSPLTAGQKRVALIGGYGCFVVAGAAVLGGLLLILFNH